MKIPVTASNWRAIMKYPLLCERAFLLKLSQGSKQRALKRVQTRRVPRVSRQIKSSAVIWPLKIETIRQPSWQRARLSQKCTLTIRVSDPLLRPSLRTFTSTRSRGRGTRSRLRPSSGTMWLKAQTLRSRSKPLARNSSSQWTNLTTETAFSRTWSPARAKRKISPSRASGRARRSRGARHEPALLICPKRSIPKRPTGCPAVSTGRSLRSCLKGS